MSATKMPPSRGHTLRCTLANYARPCATPVTPRAAGRVARLLSSPRDRLSRLPDMTVCATATEETDVEGMERVDINRTYYPKKIDTEGTGKPWFVVDAEGQILGRMATLIATMIRGKWSPMYTPSMDMGGFVIVINADKVTVSGKKYREKVYYRHTIGRPGKEKRESFRTLQNRIPERIVEHAVKGMLPKGRLGRRLFHHLKIYTGSTHPHQAQRPIDITPMINAKPADCASILTQAYF